MARATANSAPRSAGNCKDDVSYVRGNHTLKFGFDFSRIPFADDTVINYQGTLDLCHRSAFQSRKIPATIANLTKPTQFTAAIPGQYTSVPVYSVRRLYSGRLESDRRNLTLNLGLRWDKETGSYNESVNPSSFP